MTQAKPRIVIVDDHPAIVHALKRDFRRQLSVVGTAPDASLGLALTLAENPDVVLMDIQMPGRDAFIVCREIVEQTSAKVLFYTGQQRSDVTLQRAIEAGANGLACKGSETSRDLATILLHIAAGGKYLSPDWQRRLDELVREGPPLSPVSLLTPGQIEILHLLAAGQPVPQIAATLGVEPTIVQASIDSAVEKLGTGTSEALILLTAQEGIVTFQPIEAKLTASS